MKPKILERAFQDQVIDLARMFGWIVAHFRPALTTRGWRTPVQADGVGFPDLVLVHDGQKRTVYAEIKAEGGHLTPEQYFWLIALEVAGNETYVWKPSDFDEVAETLRGDKR
jgi:hypothetical protein